MKLFTVVFFLFIIFNSSSAQTKGRVLEVYSITEYKDGYLIRAIDSSSSDTLDIISDRGTDKPKKGYEKICVGNRYGFELEDRMSQMAAAPNSNLVVRIKTTVVWRSGDPMDKRPVFAKNTSGIFIKRK